MSYPQHRVVLVTSAFLTLSALHNIVRQTSVVVPLIEKRHRFVIETFVIQKDTERHKSLDSSGSPIAVCIRRFGKEVSQYRNKYVTEHILPRLDIRIRYRRISMSHQFSGISKKKSLQSSAQGSVIITHIDLTQCAGISIQYLNRLLSVRRILGNTPHDSVQISSFMIFFAWSLGRRSVLSET